MPIRLQNYMNSTMMPMAENHMAFAIEMTVREAALRWGAIHADPEVYAKTYLRNLMFSAGHTLESLAQLRGKPQAWLWDKLFNSQSVLYGVEFVSLADMMGVRSPLVEATRKTLAGQMTVKGEEDAPQVQ